MTYTIVQEDSNLTMEVKVNELLSLGWKLQGGVSITTWRDRDEFIIVSYAQALYKETK